MVVVMLDGGIAGRVARAAVTLVAPMAVFIALAVRYVRFEQLGPDEGFYGIAARNAMSGLLPYRDFAFAQAHAFPYLHGAVAALAGYGLVAQRVVCAAYAAASVLALGAAAQSPRRAFGFGLAAWAVSMSPWFVAKSALVQPCSLAGLLLLGAGAATLWMRPGRGRTWLIAVLGTLAVGCKLLVLPAAGILWAYEASRARSVESLAAPVVAMAALFVPFIALAPSQWWFWNLGYHLALSGVDFRVAVTYREHLAMAPWVFLLGVAAGLARFRSRSPALVALAAGLVGWLGQLPLQETHFDNVVPLVTLVALASGELLSEWRPGPRVRGAMAAGVLLPLAFPPPILDPLVHRDLGAAAEVLRRSVPLDRPVMTPLPVVVLQTGHPVLPGMEMGPFCTTSELPPERAKPLRLWTLPELEAQLTSDPPGAIVLTTQASTWDFYFSVPSLHSTPPEQRIAFFQAIKRAGYRKVLTNSQVSVFLRP
jgi:hypothetical protein